MELNVRKKKLRREIKNWNVAFELIFCSPPEKKDRKNIGNIIIILFIIMLLLLLLLLLARDLYEDYNSTSTHIKIRRRKMDKILKFLNISLENYITLYSYRSQS